MDRSCIYCLELKPESAFDTEHVIQQAFGKFDLNLVLDCVCRACNAYFGRELDEKLACDSFEALERVRQGLKRASKYRSLGKRSTTFGEITEEGPEKGARVWYVPNPDDDGVGIDYAPQVGVSKSREGPFIWFPLDALPEKERLYELGFERGSEVNYSLRGVKVFDDALKAMAAKGYVTKPEIQQVPPRKGRVKAEAVFRIGRPELRAMTKIAMNHLAAVVSPGVVRMPQFNEARRYVRNDVDPPWEIAWLSHSDESLVVGERDGPASRGHYIAATTVRGRIVSQVSLFSTMRYVVNVTGAPFAILPHVHCGHFFDLDRHRVVPVHPPPLPTRRARAAG